MASNNPHLPKKRSSRCAIGRSIIKRIAEFPETVSRQCSRDDRDGSFRSRSICHSDSFRRSPDNASISYRSSILTPTPSIRKSQSDHHSVQENQPSLHDSSRLRPDMIKRCSQRSETDSLDMPPGVCKSASAHNLTIDMNFLYPDHMRLHKTWSLTTTPTHSVENLTKVERSNSVLSKSREFISIGEQTRSALQSEAFDKSEICPWEVEADHSTDKNQKHVTIANSTDDKGEENLSPASPVALVCPWDHLPPPIEKNPSEDLESPKPQLTVSASAPATPRPKVFKDHRVFSFRAATTKWLSVKSFVDSIESSSRSGSLSREDSQKSHEGAASTSRIGLSSSSRRPSDEKKTLQKRSMTTVDGKPNLVKQSAIRLSSGDSSDRSPIRLAVVRSTICPWDIEDVQREATYENINLSRQNSKRSSGSSWDTASHSRTPSMHRRSSKRLTPSRNVLESVRQQSIKAEVCPWEVSERVNICPWESQEQEIKVTQQGPGQGDVCPWETQAIPATSAIHIDVQAQLSLKRSTDVGPRESSKPQVPARQDSEYANVCPWESQEVVYENLNPMDTRGSLKVPQKQPEVIKATLYPGAQKDSHLKSPVHLGVPMSKMAESCPWDFPDPPPLLETICPWEEGSMETLLTVTKKDSTTQMTIKVDVCPWESEQQESLEDVREISSGTDRGNICPWEAKQPAQVASTKMVTQSQEKIASVCPWESQETLQSQEVTYANVCPWETEEGRGEQEKLPKQIPEEPKLVQKQDSSSSSYGGNIGPREMQNAKALRRQASSNHSNVCPWETEEPNIVNKQDSDASKNTKMMKKQDSSTGSRVDVCPWEVQEPKVVKRQESMRADVCPWEEGGSNITNVIKKVDKQDSDSRVNVCPWESEQPNIIKKQDSSSSSKADVCPWEVQELKEVKKQDSRAEVCPWECEGPQVVTKQDSGGTKDQKVLKKQDSKASSIGSRTDICPWDSEKPNVLKKQESSARVDVCPWESEVPKVKKQESISSTKADVCPWEVQEPTLVKKQDSRADVCPWESENEPQAVKKQDSEGPKEQNVLKKQESSSARVDVCPWESEEPQAVKKQDSRTDVCPWEVGDLDCIKKQDSGGRADVCPWESEKPQLLTKQESGSSARVDVCPWETQESEVKKQDTGSRTDVCPWETEEQITVTQQRHDSTGAEVRSRTHSLTSLTVSESPKIHGRSSTLEASQEHGGDGEEGKMNLALGRRDALCPWEMDRSRSGSFTDNTSDVFTWEPENIPEEEEEEEDGDAETAAEALVFPPDL